MKKLIILTIAASFSCAAFSNVPFSKIFAETYKIKDGSNLAKLKCQVCHLSAKGGKLNSYGKDVKAALKKKDTKKLTKEILTSTNDLDSSKSGETNIAKIKADKAPGN